MTKYAAIQGFFESFGLSAFPEVSVPTGDDKPDFPYITYSAPTDSDINKSMATVSVWYRSTSWVPINSKVDQISEAIGAGIILDCDDGKIILRRGSPWAQPMGDDSDNMIKRKILYIEFTYATVK